MFGRIVKNILCNELRGETQKIMVRTIGTSTLCLHPETQNEADVIVNSTFPPMACANLTIDQYVWNDLNKWSSKTALVRIECFPRS